MNRWPLKPPLHYDPVLNTAVNLVLGSIPILTRREKRVCRLQIFPSFQTALRQLFISAAKMKFIFYYYQKKKNQKLLSLLQNKNAPKLFIFCLNSNCTDLT